MSIRKNLKNILRDIPAGVRLVAVSKTIPPLIIREAYNTGHRIFGENKAQELLAKQPVLPDDIKWHFIGHLQTNKVKQIVAFVEMIESVDRMKLLKEINKQALKHNRKVKCLLQFHIANEETKFGLDISEARQLLSSEEYSKMNNIEICGVMGMATFTDDEEVVRKEFANLSSYFGQLKSEFFTDQESFKEISMGMTNDYLLAIEKGSTNIRIGTAIFGDRNYQ
ncbi:MAG: YggS family pyridoxal phosphate-dependent enzyme [Bacteroidales bacterium]|nr:YggS family pyridoxal phosphate-dependent enzyme [Bacteroidales bacterium]